MEKDGIRPESLTLRGCGEEDLDAVMTLQSAVCAALPDGDLFVPSEREDNAALLLPPNFILGCFDGGTLAAYGSFAVPGESSGNYGWDLGWPVEKLLSCGKVDSIVVLPAYRGLGLQRRLLGGILDRAARIPGISCLLATVSPKNSYSLHNVQAAGFEILMKKRKYGGKERFILCRTLAAPNSTGMEGK